MNAEQQQIQSAVQHGDYASAETLIEKVLQEHPSSAKAHYIHAEILAHTHHLAQAQQEAVTAKNLDQQITFTSPEKFGQFEAYLNTAIHQQTHATAQTQSTQVVPAQPQPVPDHGTSIMPALIGALVFAVLAVLIARMFSRRPTVISNGPSYGNGIPNGYGTPPNGTGNTTIINNGTGSGIGGNVAAGLGGLAAGMMLERALDSRGEVVREVPVNESPYPPADASVPNYAEQQLDDMPFDMGNGGGWDDGGSQSDNFDSGSGGW
jgi:microcystin-dependent protein